MTLRQLRARILKRIAELEALIEGGKVNGRRASALEITAWYSEEKGLRELLCG